MSDEFTFLPAEADVLGLTGPLPAHERVSAQTPDGTISAIRWGDWTPRAGDGPLTPLVLLHGGGLNAHTWDSTVLATGLPALAVDLPGHGDSAWRDDADYHPVTVHRAVAAALEQLAPGQNVVVGQSLGGLVAGVLAGERPDLVASAVVIDAVPFAPGDLLADQPNPVRDFLAGPRSFASRTEVVERALSFGFGPDRRAVERGVALNTRTGADGRVEFKHHLAHLDPGQTFGSDFSAVWEPLQRARADLLFVVAEHGFVPPARLAELRERLPRASVVHVPGGHNVQEERPRELAHLLRDWAQGQRA